MVKKKNKVINMCPKCVCLGKSLMVNFLSSSEKKKLHIMYIQKVFFTQWFNFPKMIFHKIIEENKGVHFFKKNKGFNKRQQFFFNKIDWTSIILVPLWRCNLWMVLFLGQIHLPLTDGPSVKCVWYKNIIFFIRI